MSMCPHARRSGAIGRPSRLFRRRLGPPRARSRREIHHWGLEFEATSAILVFERTGGAVGRTSYGKYRLGEGIAR